MKQSYIVCIAILLCISTMASAYVVPDVYLPTMKYNEPSNVGYYEVKPCANCQPTPLPTPAPTYTTVNLGISISPVKSTYKVGNTITLDAYQVGADTIHPDTKFSWVYGTSKLQKSAQGRTITIKLDSSTKWSFQVTVIDNINYVKGVTKTSITVN